VDDEASWHARLVVVVVVVAVVAAAFVWSVIFGFVDVVEKEEEVLRSDASLGIEEEEAWSEMGA
jgi:hypothetical protein